MFSKNPWPGIGFDAWLLSLDAMTVIGLRTMRIAQGGASGDREAQRMVEEKMLAMFMLPFALWSSPTDSPAVACLISARPCAPIGGGFRRPRNGHPIGVALQSRGRWAISTA